MTSNMHEMHPLSTRNISTAMRHRYCDAITIHDAIA